MIAAGQRTALAALDAARSAIERLDPSRNPEDNAADLIEGWEGVEKAMRAVAGPTFSTGQALIREARQKNLLTLDQAHALVEFGAAAERARETSYLPSVDDLSAARAGFQQLEVALTHPADPPPISAPIQTPTQQESQRRSLPPGDAGVPIEPTDEVRVRARPNVAGRVLVALAAVAILGVGGFYGWQYFQSADSAMKRGVKEYQAGRRPEAAHWFDVAAQRDPKLAAPHIYAGRMYREDGNRESAVIELKKAIELEPNNALAQREMGAYLLSIGNDDLARAFYVRALRLAPDDKASMGYLSCALQRLGRTEEARRFLERAGSGAWTACATAPPPLPGAPAAPPR